MRESRTSGSVRGAHSNMCPYRDPYLPYLLISVDERFGARFLLRSECDRFTVNASGSAADSPCLIRPLTLPHLDGGLGCVLVL
jgi:hypothetical protein